MLREQIQDIQRTAYEGVVTPQAAVAGGILLALLAAWLLWRERRALGGWAAVFWGLRLGAVGLALWMLTGPTDLVTRRTTTPQSIAVMVDDSSSMSVTDPASPAEDLRWQLAVSSDGGSRQERAVALCDRAGVQLAEAAAAAGDFNDAVSDHLPTRDLRPIIERTQRAVEAAGRLLGEVSSLVAADDELLAERVDRIIAILDEDADPALDRIDQELEVDDASSSNSIINSGAALAEALESTRRRGVSLAQDNARIASEQMASATGVASTRSDRVEALMARLEKEVLSEIEKTCVVHRLRFSDFSGGEEQGRAASPGRLRVTPVAMTQDSSSAEPEDYEEDAPHSPVTDIAEALRQIELLRNSGPLRMAFMITDGRHNAPSSVTPQEVASRIATTPINVTPIGTSIPVRDILIHRVEAPSRVVRNDTATIEVMLTALDCAGEDVEVILTRDGEEIDRKPFSISKDWQDGRVAFRIDTSKPGENELGPREYEIEVGSVEDEASMTNNLGAVGIEVVRNQLRVLIADNGPRWEYRYLQQLFRRDKHVVFDEFLLQPEPRATGSRVASGRLPSNADDWDEYDVVILGDLGPNVMGHDEQTSLQEFVEDRGGALIVIGGRQNMPHRHLGEPLIDLLPVLAVNQVTPVDGFGVALTDDARLASCVALRESFRESERTWQKAYGRMPIYGLSNYCRPKPNARVLIEATPIGGRAPTDADHPLAFFSWHPIGLGKVAYLAAPQTYVLRFRRGDRDHHAFWGQTLRWITAEQGASRNPVRIDTDRTQYVAGQPIEVTVWLRDPQGRPVTDAEVEAEARSLDGVAARVTLTAEGEAPGRYVGSIARLPIGAFEVVPTGEVVGSMIASSDDNPRKLISIESSGNIEMIDTQCDRPLLEQIAKLTGGQVTPPTAVAELLEIASLDPEITESAPVRTPLWDRWSYLLVIAGCLTFEWIVRKAKGLT